MNEEISGKQKRMILIAACVILGVILAAVLGVAVYAEYLLGRLNYAGQEALPTLSQEEIDAAQYGDGTGDPDHPDVDEDSIEWGEVYHTIGGDDDIVNILLIGQDRRPGEVRTRSDSIILLSFNRVKKTITITSFMRDLYVDFPADYLDNRINVAYYYEGMEFLDETLKLNFGLVVDANVEVDFDQFRSLIDLLGGVELSLSEAEAQYINKKMERECVVEGVNLLTGTQALWHARNRSTGGNGDFGRTNRQRDVLNALIQRYKDQSITESLGLLDDILPMITTDLTRSEIINYVMALLPMLSECQIVTQSIPVEGSYYMANIRGMSVLVPDMEMNRQALIDSLTNSDTLETEE